MLILRRISGNGVQMNDGIGAGYTLLHKERNPKEFSELFLDFFGHAIAEEDNNSNSCYGFVIGSHTHPLYKNQGNFIMTGDGKTFDNVSFK